MKIKAWIITGLLSVVAFSASSALSATMSAEDREVTDALNTLKTSSNNTTAVWPELEKFQVSLWKAMALDPGPIAVVPIKLVPQELYAEDLTADLNQQLDGLKQSNIPNTLHAQVEYSQYLQTVRKIIAFRIARQFPQARAFAKRGTLGEQYAALMKKLQPAVAGGVNPREEAAHKVETYIQTIKDNKTNSENKKAPFANGNQFIWSALIALIGFALGITAIKMKPEYFEKMVSDNIPKKFSDSTAPAATHTNRLNYARWLREFEALLAKLKATQLTHERRIEEVDKHSERLIQYAIALSSDPRIKSEANLEYRVSNLMREIQNQLDHTHELKTGDRAQIHVTLEHCLKLCDAIENDAVEYHSDQAGQPPQNNPNIRSAG